MLAGIVDHFRSRKNRNLAYLAGGTGLMLLGSKVTALALIAKGMWSLETLWREKRGFSGTWADRFEIAGEFYEGTHQDPVNRALHVTGIPIIVAGIAGMLAFPAWSPLWLLSNWMFVFGWVLNFIGHGLFEKNSPAFTADPLSFVAGPMWDVKQLRRALSGTRQAAPSAAPVVRVLQPSAA